MRKPAYLGRRYTPPEAAGDRRAHSLCPACLPCSCLCLLTAVPSHQALCAPSAMQLQPRSAFCHLNTFTSAVCWPQGRFMEHSNMQHQSRAKGQLLSKGGEITEGW